MSCEAIGARSPGEATLVAGCIVEAEVPKRRYEDRELFGQVVEQLPRAWRLVHAAAKPCINAKVSQADVPDQKSNERK
jgi:hypothetical protein